MSGYQDSNLGPPAPKAGALTGLRYTPLSIVIISDCDAKVSIISKLQNISVFFLKDILYICFSFTFVSIIELRLLNNYNSYIILCTERKLAENYV